MLHISLHQARRKFSITPEMDSPVLPQSPSNPFFFLRNLFSPQQSSPMTSTTINTTKNKNNDDDDSNNNDNQISKSNIDSDAISKSPCRRRRHRIRPVHEPRLSCQSAILSKSSISTIHNALPLRFSTCDWQRVYSTMHDGASLHTLYSRCSSSLSSCSDPIILCIRDSNRKSFGCFVTEPWRVQPHYYGTGETFVFSIDDQNETILFPWSRSNSLFQLATTESLALGGGRTGGFALFIDSMLERGASRYCPTFDSPCLASCDQFNIVVLEAFALVPTHRLVENIDQD